MDCSFLKNILSERLFKNDDIIEDVAHLKENESGAYLRHIKIDGVSSDAILLKCDKIKTDSLYQKGKGQNMKCDYLLISNGIAYFIELKSTENPSSTCIEECINKFMSVECISEYIDAVTEKIYSMDRLFSSIEKRFILLHSATPVDKLSTSVKNYQMLENDIINNKPEQMMKIGVINGSVINITELSN